MTEDVFRIREIDRRQLDNERARLLRLVSGAVPFGIVREVGSTALEDLVGKQDLDFVVRVPADRFGHARAALDFHFARNTAQFADEKFQGYRANSVFDAAIQLTVIGGPHDDFDKFLDRLKGDAALRRAYNELKQAFDGRPMEDYRLAKRAFIEAALAAPVRKE
jgi:GrpB-like predicted nucleotidyltransferase (UPF0157 family)